MCNNIMHGSLMNLLAYGAYDIYELSTDSITSNKKRKNYKFTGKNNFYVHNKNNKLHKKTQKVISFNKPKIKHVPIITSKVKQEPPAPRLRPKRDIHWRKKSHDKMIRRNFTQLIKNKSAYIASLGAKITNATCPISMEKIENKFQKCNTCKKCFDSFAISTWLFTNRSCPMCRSPMRYGDIHYDDFYSYLKSV